MGEAHAAAALPEQRRIDYLVAVAAMVYADRHVADAELGVLRRLGAELGLEQAALANVERTASQPDATRVEAILRSFQSDACRYALLTDAILVALADRRISPGEPEETARFARALGVPTVQVVLIARYVQRQISGDEGQEGHADRSRILPTALAHAAAQVHSPSRVRRLYQKLLGKAATPRER